jgi:hypothetical protein
LTARACEDTKWKMENRTSIQLGCFPTALILVLGFGLASPAQQPRSPQMPAPPPMKFIPPDERAQLSETRDPKSRTRATVELADAHLSRAEELTEKKKYDLAAGELGNYLALIEDALQFLGNMNSRGTGKTRDLYKRLDLALRAHLPHLAKMRRSTPAEYAINIKEAEDFTRNARSEALDPFYKKVVGEGDEKPTGDKAKSPAPTNHKEP